MVVPLAWTGGASALMTAAPPAVERLPDLFHSVFSCRVGRRHGSRLVNGVLSFLWRKSRQRGDGAVDRPPRCPLLVAELCQRMSALAAA